MFRLRSGLLFFMYSLVCFLFISKDCCIQLWTIRPPFHVFYGVRDQWPIPWRFLHLGENFKPVLGHENNVFTQNIFNHNFRTLYFSIFIKICIRLKILTWQFYYLNYNALSCTKFHGIRPREVKPLLGFGCKKHKQFLVRPNEYL